jgi:hypothetical protein
MATPSCINPWAFGERRHPSMVPTTRALGAMTITLSATRQGHLLGIVVCSNELRRSIPRSPRDLYTLLLAVQAVDAAVKVSCLAVQTTLEGKAVTLEEKSASSTCRRPAARERQKKVRLRDRACIGCELHPAKICA